MHSQLISECEWYLKQLGFKDIRKEVIIKPSGDSSTYFRIDLLVSDNNTDIPVECGNIGNMRLDSVSKVLALTNRFPYIFWYPVTSVLLKIERKNISLFGIPHVEKLSCMRCGFTWFPKVDNPMCCPKCKSSSWNKPRASLCQSNKISIMLDKTIDKDSIIVI